MQHYVPTFRFLCKPTFKIMRTTLLSFLVILNVYTFALPPTQIAPLSAHLLEVNARWKYVDMRSAEFSECYSFTDDRSRIQAHLGMVGNVLLNKTGLNISSEQLQARKELLADLEIYREVGNFPKNLYHPSRRPYFIDEFGTACAVGHLIQVSGEAAFATQISEEMNVAYLMDMPYPQLEQWADKHGFTKEELALIQPGYTPQVRWSSMGTGANGEITALYGDEANQRLIIAGDFTELDGVSCSQIGVYENGAFGPLGTGLVGEIQDIILFNNDIYVGGSFANGANIAFWDGQNWTYERFGEGSVHALYVYDNKLLAGGDFQVGTAASDTLSYIAAKENGNWVSMGNSFGPVYALALHQDELYAGGSFLESSSEAYVKKLSTNGSAYYWSDATQPLEKLDNTVRSLVSNGTYLFAGGACYDTMGNPTFCLARLGNSGWERLVSPRDFTNPDVNIKHLLLHEGDLLVSGNFRAEPFVGIYGEGIGKLRDFRSAIGLEPLSIVDSTVNTSASVNGKLYIGGAFDGERFGNAALNYLAETPALTSIDPKELLSVGFYPNPMSTEARASLDISKPITEIQLFDLAGRELRTNYEIQGNELILQRGQLIPGMYLVKISSEKETLAYAKIWVQ